jgi:anaerobic magnesium-protoporphyrin IX monomethyl ester cyclase
MKVTLIYVGVGVAGFSSSRPLGDREGSWIGHGVASIGANLKHEGWNVDLIDLRQLGGWEEVEEKIKGTYADVYGLSVSAVDYYPALYTAVLIKRHHKESKVIVGGIHPTIFPDLYEGRPEIDTVVIGEGEITMDYLVGETFEGKDLPKRARGIKPNLNAIPWVDREMFEYWRELNCQFTPDQKLPSITMLSGRGCPFKCTYCQPAENAVFGVPYRSRSVDSVMAELIWAKQRYRYESITFWDDTFIINPRWVEEFCEKYTKAEIGATIAACGRADLICKNEERVEQLASAGLDWFVIGMESGSQRLLDLIKKGTTVEQNIKAAEMCRKYGIKVFATYMYGLPTETKEEALETARMIDSILSIPALSTLLLYRALRYTHCANGKNC